MDSNCLLNAHSVDLNCNWKIPRTRAASVNGSCHSSRVWLYSFAEPKCQKCGYPLPDADFPAAAASLVSGRVTLATKTLTAVMTTSCFSFTSPLGVCLSEALGPASRIFYCGKPFPIQLISHFGLLISGTYTKPKIWVPISNTNSFWQDSIWNIFIMYFKEIIKNEMCAFTKSWT